MHIVTPNTPRSHRTGSCKIAEFYGSTFAPIYRFSMPRFTTLFTSLRDPMVAIKDPSAVSTARFLATSSCYLVRCNPKRHIVYFFRKKRALRHSRARYSHCTVSVLSLIHISEPTRQAEI